MLAAISWNNLQRFKKKEKVDVVKWSKRRGAWVLETRTKRIVSDSLPPYMTALMARAVDMVSGQLDLPPMEVPQLHRRGSHVPKPSAEELRQARPQP